MAALAAAVTAAGAAQAGGPPLAGGSAQLAPNRGTAMMVGDLALTYVGPGSVGLNQTATFTFKPFNNGPGTVNSATKIKVEVVLPSQFEYPITMTGAGWTCSSFFPPVVTVSCTYAGVPVPAHAATPPIVVTVVARHPGGFANCATVAFLSSQDANPDDNRSCIDGAVH